MNLIKDIEQNVKKIKLGCCSYEKIQDNIQYNIDITFDGITRIINKTAQQIKNIYNSLQQEIFELQQYKLTTNEDNNVIIINKIMNQLRRGDVLMNEKFQKQFNLNNKINLQSNQFIKLTSVIIFHQQGYNLIKIIYQFKDNMIFALHRCKPIKKITNFIKSFISDQDNGYLTIRQKHNNNWIIKHHLTIQPTPIDFHWNKNGSLLTVVTNIGVYFYIIAVQTNYDNISLIQFIKLIDIIGFCYTSSLRELYLLTADQLYVYSHKKEILIKTINKLTKPTALIYDEQNYRLFVSDNKGINIFIIDGIQIKFIYLIPSTSITSLLIIHNNYLLSLNRGYITVYELKCYGKQKCINMITNINCPQQTINLACSLKENLLICTYKSNIILISSTNQPICSIREKNIYLTDFKYHANSKEIICCNKDGEVFIYTINLTNGQ